jgi:type I restriction enzyme S subunit
MFGDPVTNPKGWDKKAFIKTCNIVTGNTPSRANIENYGNYIEWIKTDNIQAVNSNLTPALEYLSKKGFEKCRYVETNSILMTCIAGSLNSIGNVAITDRRVAFNQQINALTPKDYNYLFLYWLLRMMKSEIHDAVNMMLKGILSKGNLSKIEAIVPPLALQNRFADFVKQIDKISFVMQKELEKLELSYKALMQQYFG